MSQSCIDAVRAFVETLSRITECRHAPFDIYAAVADDGASVGSLRKEDPVPAHMSLALVTRAEDLRRELSVLPFARAIDVTLNFESLGETAAECSLRISCDADDKGHEYHGLANIEAALLEVIRRLERVNAACPEQDRVETFKISASGLGSALVPAANAQQAVLLRAACALDHDMDDAVRRVVSVWKECPSESWKIASTDLQATARSA